MYVCYIWQHREWQGLLFIYVHDWDLLKAFFRKKVAHALSRNRVEDPNPDPFFYSCWLWIRIRVPIIQIGSAFQVLEMLKIALFISDC